MKGDDLFSGPSVLLLEPVHRLCKAGIHVSCEVCVGVAIVLTDPLYMGVQSVKTLLWEAGQLHVLHG